MENKTEAKAKTLLEAITAARANFGSIKKDSDNPFFKSKYADLQGHLDAVIPALAEQGVLLTQPIVRLDSGQFVVRSILLGHGDSLFSELPLPELTDPQKVGSAITYYRRYTLAALLSLAAEDDDGNEASNAKGKVTSEANQKLAAKREQAAAAKPAEKSLTPNFDGIALADTPMPGKLNGQKLGTVDLNVLEGLRSGEHAQLFKTHYPEHWKRVDEYLSSL